MTHYKTHYLQWSGFSKNHKWYAPLLNKTLSNVQFYRNDGAMVINVHRVSFHRHCQRAFVGDCIVLSNGSPSVMKKEVYEKTRRRLRFNKHRSNVVKNKIKPLKRVKRVRFWELV